MISILTPSRGRPEGLHKLFQSINETMSGKIKVELLIGLDEDDPLISSYLYTITGMRKKAHEKLTVNFQLDHRKMLARIWNDLAAKAENDWMTVGNDDMIFKTKDWDLTLEKYIEKSHPFNLYFFDDGLQHGNHCAFPIISKDWVKALGYFFPEIFHHNYVDTWIFDIAQRAKAWTYISEVKNQHLHYSLNLHPYDETYRQGNNYNEDDRVMYLSHMKEREAAAKIIELKIEQWIKN